MVCTKLSDTSQYIFHKYGFSDNIDSDWMIRINHLGEVCFIYKSNADKLAQRMSMILFYGHMNHECRSEYKPLEHLTQLIRETVIKWNNSSHMIRNYWKNHHEIGSIDRFFTFFSHVHSSNENNVCGTWWYMRFHVFRIYTIPNSDSYHSYILKNFQSIYQIRWRPIKFEHVFCTWKQFNRMIGTFSLTTVFCSKNMHEIKLQILNSTDFRNCQLSLNSRCFIPVIKNLTRFYCMDNFVTLFSAFHT